MHLFQEGSISRLFKYIRSRAGLAGCCRQARLMVSPTGLTSGHSWRSVSMYAARPVSLSYARYRDALFSYVPARFLWRCRAKNGGRTGFRVGWRPTRGICGESTRLAARVMHVT